MRGSRCTYLDPDTGEVLPTWDQALDAITGQDEPLHAARFGARFDAQGVLAGSCNERVLVSSRACAA